MVDGMFCRGTVVNIAVFPNTKEPTKKPRRVVQVQLQGQKLAKLIEITDFSENPIICNPGQRLCLPLEVKEYKGNIQFTYFGGVEFEGNEKGQQYVDPSFNPLESGKANGKAEGKGVQI